MASCRFSKALIRKFYLTPFPFFDDLPFIEGLSEKENCPDYGVLSLLREGVPVPFICLLCIECVLMNARPVLCLAATSIALLLLF